MVFIKKIVMSGFKSFAKKTEILFDRGVNVILGPNGSGKSNVSDALCFVLGRLSIKSMRAAKAKNLLFMGSKYVKPAKEATVDLVFDNSDKLFALDSQEVHLTRMVRHNGQSIYKINGETKTRTEVVEMLAQAGIDPHGFNLILQGQIQSIVRMHPEERRKIVEEVAGISIYESRKEKSLHELEKTDEKLKEISAILRERTSYMKNLDRERAQALKFKELETTVKRSKYTILHKRTEDKEKEIASIIRSIEEKSEQKDKQRKDSEDIQDKVNSLSESIQQINKHIQQATGLEQENLHNSIANLKAELEGLKVRRENYENRKNEVEKRISEMQKSIPELEKEIKGLKEESPLMAKKAQELRKKKDELEELEQERRKLLTMKSELNGLRERIKDKERQIARAIAESDSTLKQIEENSRDLKHNSEESCAKALENSKKQLVIYKQELEELNGKALEHEKIISISENDIQRANKVKADVNKIDTCPLCQSKITEEHLQHVFKDSDDKIKDANDRLENSKRGIQAILEKRSQIVKNIRALEESISEGNFELVKQRNIKDKKELLKRLVQEEKVLKDEIIIMEDKRKSLEEKSGDVSSIEEKYEMKMMEIEEISSRTVEDSDTAILYKQRDLEGFTSVIKRSRKDLEEINSNIKEISESLESKARMLEEKENQEEELQSRYKKLFEQRERNQKDIHDLNFQLSEVQNSVRAIEDQINYLRIGKAKLDAEKEAIGMEMSEYPGLELMQGSMQVLEERMKKAQEALMQIGSINMRALEVYEDVKKEYDLVFEKVTTLENEKGQILKIIEEIDHKKIKSFMKTFKAMNALFTENFAKLSSKGVAFLELENPEDIFAGGVNIVVRLAKGKYFDVTSLSGGEQTLVALSLLFAIQEYKPYHFYVFDEIDAALDKRNSERLSALLTQYMKSGQYIVITHNDAIIMNSNVLYGVSMHDGVSKVLSLKISEEVEKEVQEEKKQEEKT